MKRILYGNLVGKSRPSLREEGEGDITTKAILDVDDCVEGMRKFTTEVFDTGAGKSTLFKLLLGLYERAADRKRKTKMVWLRGAVLSHGAGND